LKLKDELRMRAKLVMMFSADAGNAKPTIKDAIEEANRTILIKGAPQSQESEAAKVTSWET